MKRLKSLLFLIVMFGAILRLYLIFMIPGTNSDGLLYAWAGVNLADGHGFSIAEGTSLGDSSSWHVPEYPLLLGLTYNILGTGFLVSKLPSLIFGIGTIFLTYMLAAEIFDERVAHLSAFFVSIHPLMVYILKR